MNKYALKLWGYTDISEVKDKNLSSFFLQEKKFKIIYNHLNTEKKWTGRLLGLSKNNSSFDVEASFKAINVHESNVKYIITFKNISVKLQNKRLYKKYKDRFLNFFNSAPDGVLIVSDKGIIETANPKSLELFGYKKEELLGKPVEILIPQQQRKKHVIKRKSYKKSPSQRSMGSVLNLYGLRNDGKTIPLDILLGPMQEEGEEKVLVVARDISKIKKSNDIIVSSLKEKEILLKEVHHRVKNNLAVVSALLQLQEEQSKSKKLSTALKEGINRIQSIASVHEQLYQEGLFSSINLNTYINKLCNILADNYNVRKREVDISIECDDIKLSMEQAVPVALILNEIITNSYKYATVDGRFNIWITVKKIDNSITLMFKDNGPGLPNKYLDQDFVDPSGLGLTLIKVLSNQLNANLTIDNTPGTTYMLEFSTK